MSAAQALNPAVSNPLRIEKSYAEYMHQLYRLTETAWHIAYTALWNTQTFEQSELEAARNFISGFLKQEGKPKENYLNLVQRVLLARSYISCHPGFCMPAPGYWFDPANTKGFAGTGKWLQSVEQTRESCPGYRQALAGFASAVWETTENWRAADFHRWRSYFIQHQAQGLLNLYLAVVANCCLAGNAAE